MMESETIELRRKPTQERSRKRYDAILGAARELILEKGVDGLVLNEVAERAGVPIGSVYQYFSGKSSVVRAIAEEHLEALHEIMNRELQKTTSLSLSRVAQQLIDLFYKFYSADPIFLQVWGSNRQDPALRQCDIQDLRFNAGLLAEALYPFLPGVSRKRLESVTLIICESVNSVLMLGLELEASETKAMLKELKVMTEAYLNSLLD